MKKVILILFITVFLSSSLLSQNTQLNTKDTVKESAKVDTTGPKYVVYDKYKLPSIFFGIGMMSFHGDIGPKYKKISPLSNFNLGVNLGVDKRFGNTFGVALNLMYGKVSESGIKGVTHLNFESKIFSGDLTLQIHLDNDWFFNKSSRFAPYFLIGVGYLNYNPKLDLLDKDGNSYHYWSDGSIRIGPETISDPDEVKTTKRDNKYETSSGNDGFAFQIPVGMGFKFKLSDKFEGNIFSIYYLTATDKLDNFNFNNNKKFCIMTGKADGYLYSGVGLKYNLGGKKMPKPFIPTDTILPIDLIPQDTIVPQDTLLVIEDTTKSLLKDSIIGLDSTIAFTITPDSIIKPENTIDSLEKGTYYRIQIAALKNKNGIKVYQQNFSIEDKDLRYTVEKGLYKYTLNNYTDLEKAVEDNKIFRKNTGVKSFVVKFDDGKRSVPVQTYRETNVTSQTKADVPTEVTIRFKIQLGSSANKYAKDYYQKRYGINEQIYVERYQGAYKYFYGDFASYKAAKEVNDKFRKKGLDSFIISFKNDRRVSVKQALQQANQ
ncbi:MAG: hypothetical protein A2X12_05065 [Bacteroidetes bacterium GWE2_29_8]|nr:MAG: hypothetical protein A2X12_05065 [Bacteroidetes bacterium GWE2_29_8]